VGGESGLEKRGVIVIYNTHTHTHAHTQIGKAGKAKGVKIKLRSFAVCAYII